MDRKILKQFAFLLLAGSMAACEKDADIPVPNEKTKLVVYSYITPTDTAIHVSISSSNPVFENNPTGLSPVTNATVTIEYAGSTFTLPYNSSNGLYSISTGILPVVAGNAYTLHASASGFDAVTCSTVVPSLRSFDLTSVFTGSTPPNSQTYSPKLFRFVNTWRHFSNSDYYRIAPTFYSIDTTLAVDDTAFITYHSAFFSAHQATSGIISDNIEVGSSISFEPYPNPHGFFMDLIVSGYDYYTFHESLNNYTSGDPFAEPSLIYTNVTNGYGIFAGYLRYRVHPTIP